MSRTPRHLLVAASAWLARLLTIGLSVVNLRLLTSRLGSDDYAAYVLVANLAPWAALLDPGLGSALQNELGRRRVHGEDDAPVVAGALLVVTAISVLAAIVGVLCAPWAGPAYVGRFVGERGVEVFRIGAVVQVMASLGAFAHRIWYGRQQGHWANLALTLSALGSTLALMSVRGGSLALTLLAGLGPAALVGVVCLVLTAPRRWSVLVEALWSPTTRRLVRTGAGFWGLALAATAVLNLDYLVLSRFLAGRDAVEYSIVARLFDVTGLLYSVLLLAYWPAAAEALARGELVQVRRTSARYAALALGAMLLAGLGCMALRGLIVRVLAPSQSVQLSYGLIMAMTALAMAKIWTNTSATVVQALGRVRVLLVVAPLQAVANAVLMGLLVPRLGVVGIPLATTCSYLLTAAWMLPLYVWRLRPEDIPAPAASPAASP